MTWLSWRQQRTETVMAAAFLVLLTALLLPSGLHLASFYDQQHVAGCINRHTAVCQATIESFSNQSGVLRSFMAGGWFNLVPGLIGVALAAPLVLDLEQGTIRLAWTQSVTRRRWLATKLGLAVLTALAAGTALSLLFWWYRRPLDAVYGRWDNGAFDVEGLVPLAYVLFGLGLTVAIGVIWRRTAAAAVVGLAAYVAARVFVQSLLRQHFATPLSGTWGPHSSGPDLSRAWIISIGPSDKAGHPFSAGYALLRQCAQVSGNVKSAARSCLARHGAGYTHAIWQPASRFWEFQGIETALFGGVALLLLGLAAAWLVRRPA